MFAQKIICTFLQNLRLHSESTKSENMPETVCLSQLPASLVGGNHIYMYTFKRRRPAVIETYVWPLCWLIEKYAK